MTTPAYQRKRAGMISGLLQTSEYAREFLHLACGPLNHGEDEIDRMVAKLGYRSASMSAVLSSRCALDPTAITGAGALAASWSGCEQPPCSVRLSCAHPLSLK